MDLNKLDYEIMSIFFKRIVLTDLEIEKFLPELEYATSERLKLLESEGLIEKLKLSYSFQITPKGRMIFQDNKIKKWFLVKMFVLETMRSIFCPIIVSLITSAIYNYYVH